MLTEVVTLVSVTAILLGSPGPAPIALAATGASAGVKRGLPFLAGILLGLLLASVGAAIGLSLIIEMNPLAKRAVQILGAAYIVYVAYKIASGPVLVDDTNDAQFVPSFIDGFLLNLLNPKAYAAFFALFSQFALTAHTQLMSLIYTGMVSFAVGVFVDFLWLALGGAIGPFFRRPRAARALRLSFGGLMILAVLWVFLGDMNYE